MNKKRNSKEKLIEAMADLLLEKGFANTSPKDILTRADVGQGSFYHHFSGKADLAFQAIKYNVELLIASNTSALKTEGNAYKKLLMLLLKTRDINKGCLVGQLARDSSIMENKILADEVTRGFNSMKQTLESIIKIGIAEGSISNTFGCLEAVALIMSTLQGAYIIAKGFQDYSYFNLAVNTLLKVFMPNQ